MSISNSLLIPNVGPLPSAGGVQPNSVEKLKGPKTGPGDFDQILDQMAKGSDIKNPLKMSAHAAQRLQDRKIQMDPATWAKVSRAVDQAEAKGLEDALVLTGDAAFIVSVKNRTIVTALDRGSAQGNVFTNIDGAVIA
jgi:flagellar operon protein